MKTILKAAFLTVLTVALTQAATQTQTPGKKQTWMEKFESWFKPVRTKRQVATLSQKNGNSPRVAIATKTRAGTQASKNGSKYICTINVLDDATFTEVYDSKEECGKLCKGPGAVCEETGKQTPVDITEVD